ncbi:hypothetical protein UFOVP447_108 [uncultured Caudovirales phage]|uniref:Uncharacterized protein n=1 Tax=uncultured Caudovirales phage TaxID=2100421 RepID=A0A6J5MBY5_9CAUD|nr:hypothetical protein UFOVP447_108 [uncultured Caudovirales phage]
MTKREAVPFTNDFGQVINPGDEVVVVTTCTGSTNTQKGKYVGMSGKSVQAEVPSNSWAYFVKGTDERAPANFHNELYKSGFKWNTPEWKELRDKVYAPYEYRKTGGTRITTLYYNRIYKLAA